MNRKTTATRTPVLSLSALALMATAGVLFAGPLDPPAGPVTSTFKTLTEVEPRIAINATNTPGDGDSLFRITQPGSYYLTGNITGVAARHGIEIAASGVTLDLNGFELVGVVGSLDGVSASAADRTNIAVVNGSIRSWGDDGVDLRSIFTLNCRLADLLVSANTGTGISAGFNSTVSNCSAFQNGDTGINSYSGCTFTNCTASLNTGAGISPGLGSTLSNCAAFFNIGDGISAGGACTITGCSVRDNSSRGILMLADCTVIGCTVSLNDTAGIEAGARCTILKTVVNSTTSGPGVTADTEGLRIEDSSIHGNSTFGVVVNTASDIAELAVVNCTIRGNGSDGINSEASTQVLDSIVSGNGTGIFVTSSSFIRGCTVTSNIAAGIELTSNANVVANNTVSSNAPVIATAAGILVRGTDNTIDGNRLFSNIQGGIKVNSAGNLVLRNYLARTGATITAVAGNSVAQIVVSPGSGFISTDPNANFTY